MYENLIIRKCIEKDEDDYVRLNLDFVKAVKEEHPYWDSLKLPSEKEMRQTFNEALASPEHITIFVCEIDEKVVAYANTWTAYSIWSMGKALTIDDLYVEPSFRNKAIGSKMIKSIIEYCKENGYKRVQMHAEMDNTKVHKLYKKLGFNDEEMLFFMSKLE